MDERRKYPRLSSGHGIARDVPAETREMPAVLRPGHPSVTSPAHFSKNKTARVVSGKTDEHQWEVTFNPGINLRLHSIHIDGVCCYLLQVAIPIPPSPIPAVTSAAVGGQLSAEVSASPPPTQRWAFIRPAARALANAYFLSAGNAGYKRKKEPGPKNPKKAAKLPRGGPSAMLLAFSRPKQSAPKRSRSRLVPYPLQKQLPRNLRKR